MDSLRISVLSLLAGTAVCLAVGSTASATPVYGSALRAGQTADVQNIGYRHHYYRHWGWGRGFGVVGDGYTDLGQPTWGSLYWYPPGPGWHRYGYGWY